MVASGVEWMVLCCKIISGLERICAVKGCSGSRRCSIATAVAIMVLRSESSEKGVAVGRTVVLVIKYGGERFRKRSTKEVVYVQI